MFALAGLVTPRKLSLLLIALFVVAVLFIQASPYPAGLPQPESTLGREQESDVRVSRPEQLKEGLLRVPVDDTPIDLAPGNGRVLAEHGFRPEDPTTTSIHATTTQKTALAATTSTITTTSRLRTSVQHSFKTLSHGPSEQVASKVQSLIAAWTPPSYPHHWPPYEWYGANTNYDPNRWEGLDWENDYYIRNGLEKLKKEYAAAATPTPYLPYPDYNSQEWKEQWQGEYVACMGPRGKLLNESSEDIVRAYPVTPKGFPTYAVGDANATGIDVERCFDRYNRFGPYGYNQDETEKVLDWKRPSERPDWNYVDWGDLQDQCLRSNEERYAINARRPIDLRPSKELPKDHGKPPDDSHLKSARGKYHSRTALLIRSWEGYVYTSNDIEAIRALSTELSLLSGGEYQVFLLVDVKDRRADIYGNGQAYKDLLEAHVPRELHSISILWNENMLEEWYPKIGDWQVYWHQFMPLQWFSKRYPEFDYVWNWETDARSTGNHYHLLEKLREFSKKQPRKFLWERNARFYFPAAHGSYDAWLDDTHASIYAAYKDGNLQPVWGPQPYNATLQPLFLPVPAHSMDMDDFEWGVDEEADLITLQPIWDPTHTQWTMRDKIWNFLPGIRPHFTDQSPIDEGFTHPDFVNIPRRAFINTLSRFSRRQLHAMHMENRAGRTMQAEMWPATVALHYGLKAVYAPHPIWTDHRWPAWYMDAVFNADGGEKARWGARGDSVYNQDREHNFAGWSWYYASDFPRILYRRWLGWPANVGPAEQYPNNPLLSLGGEKFEEEGVKVHLPGDSADGSQAAPPGGSFGGREMVVGGNGRMCLPPMLLHPIKKVYRGADDEQTRGS